MCIFAKRKKCIYAVPSDFESIAAAATVHSDVAFFNEHDDVTEPPSEREKSTESR